MPPIDEPLVSVIVPAHNVAPYIEQCVRSILDQSYGNLELVVVDDGSEDETGSILDGLASRDRRLRVIHRPSNEGVHNARAAGLAAACGSLVGFADGDDYIAPNMLSRLVQSLVETQSDIAICGMMTVSDDGKPIGHKVRFPQAMTFESGLLEHFCRLRFGTGSLCNKVFRKEVIDYAFAKSSGFALVIGEDYIVNLSAFSRAKGVRVIPDVGYNYRKRASSASNTTPQAPAFAHTLRTYVIALEMFADAGEDAKRSIDHLYSQLLRYYGNVGSDGRDFDDVRGYMGESLVRLARIRPEAVHSLVHPRGRASESRRKRDLLAPLRRGRRMFGQFVSRAG